MKLIVKADALVKVLTEAFDAIPVKSTDPYFMNFLLNIKEEGLEVLASDGNCSIKVQLPKSDGKNENIVSLEPGSIQVPAKTFLEISRKLSGSTITLDLKDSELFVSDGRTSYNLTTSDAKEYPNISVDFDDAKAIKVSYPDFAKLFSSTAFAVATKGTKPCFLGINIRTEGDKLYFLATDACRLAQKSVTIQAGDDVCFTVPVKVLSMIAKKSDAKEVDIELGDGKALFKVANSILNSRLLNGEFPSINRIRPQNTPYKLTVNSEDFLKSLDRVTLVTQGNLSSIARLTADKDHAELTAFSQPIGNAKEVLENFTFEGELFDISFNIRFVGEAIKALASPKVTLAFAGEGKLFMVENGDDSNFQIITPIRSNM